MRKASILIRTKNEARHLEGTLDAVLSQSVEPHEVFVIDSGSTDDTLKIARSHPVRILQIAPRRWSYPRALNLGARECTGDILVCLSAHCQPVDSKWLSNLLRHFDDPEVAAVWGPDPIPGRRLPEPTSPQRQVPGSYTARTSKWGLSNTNSALRRDLWARSPFDESLPAAEDKAWAREAMDRGYSIVFDPAAAVWHKRHGALRGYRRNKLVRQAYGMMWPEMNDRPLRALLVVSANAWRRLSLRVSTRDASGLWQELRGAPSALASAMGTVIGSRRPR